MENPYFFSCTYFLLLRLPCKLGTYYYSEQKNGDLFFFDALFLHGILFGCISYWVALRSTHTHTHTILLLSNL